MGSIFRRFHLSSPVERIERALEAAQAVLDGFDLERIETARKSGGDPVTEADVAVDDALRSNLPEPDEGWLSEETADSPERLDKESVWIVDPLDGTREFVEGIPEWCVSIAYVVDGQPVAGGILSPPRNISIVGAVGEGVTVNGEAFATPTPTQLPGALVLASRSEVKRGEWDAFFKTEIAVRNMGSVALKLGLVAAGQADATWTLVPKNEWDVAGGAALVLAAGGVVSGLDGEPVRFNRENTLMSGFVATGSVAHDAVIKLIDDTPWSVE
ncbi:MAG: 3'(2'),5'-bisphosphate nucleotidase CysQ [Acidimicrobiia bacterium]|nr:3'(2'),5'-bisphosphate nucleotidase CysQ [Acidimicrobiia bacterium]